MAKRIIQGAYDYTYVMEKRADLKPAIDTYLASVGRSDLIVV